MPQAHLLTGAVDTDIYPPPPTWDGNGESKQINLIISFEKGNTKALGLFAKIFDLICRQASGQGEADRC